MPVIVPRWEWRAFAEQFPSVHARLAGTPHNLRASSEIYIVSAASDANVKVRDGQLDVKLLQQVDRGLELWAPAMKAPFPIDRSVCETVFAHWQATPVGLDRPHYSLQQFLDEAVARSPLLSVHHVTKERRGFELGGCGVELALLSIDGQPVESVAVEHEDPERVLGVVRALGFADLANVNYVRALKSMLGAAASTPPHTAPWRAPL